MKTIFIILISFLATISVLAANFKTEFKSLGGTQIPFVHNADVSTETFYNQKVDFAELEKRAPLSQTILKDIKATDLKSLTMEEFNQLYARLKTGPMPQGNYSGFLLQKPPVYYALRRRILDQIIGAKQFASFAKQICKQDGEDCFIELIWKGKLFYKKDDMDRIQARTTVNWLNSGLKVNDWLPDSVSKKIENVTDLASKTFFPMHTFCGISQVDTRRESIIVDAAYGDEFSDRFDMFSDVVNRKGQNITEEYRMVHPGLYIGKVYANKLFLMNVAIEQSGTLVSTETTGTCFDSALTAK